MQKNQLVTIKEYCGVDLIRNRFLNEEKILQIADTDNGGSVIRTIHREKITCIDSYDDIVQQLSPNLFLKGFVDPSLTQRITLPFKYIRFFLHPEKERGEAMHKLWHIYTTFARSHPMHAPAESVEQLPIAFAKFDRYLSAGQVESCYINIEALKEEHFEPITIGDFSFTRVTYGSLVFMVLQSLTDVKNLKDVAHQYVNAAYPYIELNVKRWVDRKGDEHSARFTIWINPIQISNVQNGGWGTEVMLGSGELYFVENSVEDILTMIQQKKNFLP
ncbi:hypothetical protein PVA44_00815 [Entomospira nematocerorum]|uniref:Uncharacterized protein n=1 Tax=Entomospira nematocerorum TaxID=2719987 RepID=A0A968GHW1_9SPIO|nr:hypothetical protein [Entomospira nematocera]NIZ47421.1 hypothetical protein [Entomospira nematocera]WDI34040.1 hypothetical protein PVA44_00815 [Entomospira nematocera]